jgi:predicted HD superfamily hydrolase involved in NAD metabolism
MHEYISNLKQIMSKFRVKHSIAVAEVAVYLAEKHGISIQKAYVAGILHDCAKELNFDDYKRFGINCENIVDFEFYKKNAPKILHSFASKELAKVKFGITDKEVLDAIAHHTMGRADMTVLDKIIFIADFIEPNRDFEGLEKIKEIAEADLDKAVLLVLKSKLNYMIEHDIFIAKDTILTWNAMVKQ